MKSFVSRSKYTLTVWVKTVAELVTALWNTCKEQDSIYLRTERLEIFLRIFLPLIQLAKLLVLRGGNAWAGIGKQRDFSVPHPVIHNEDKMLFSVGGCGWEGRSKWQRPANLMARCLINT